MPRRSKAWLRLPARNPRVVLLLSLGYVLKFNPYDFWLTEPLAFLSVAAALLRVVLRLDIGFAICLAIGVLAKESVFFVVGLHDGLPAKRPVGSAAVLNTSLWRFLRSRSGSESRSQRWGVG